MKNVILLAISVILLASCAPKKAIANNNTKPALTKAELETMYVAMIHSDEYKKLDAAEDAYYEKLNYNNSYIEITEKDLKDGALKWIKKHLPDTKFLSLDEAEAEYENILALQGEVTTNHEAFYSAFGNEANHKNLSEIMLKYESVRVLN